MNTCMRMCTCVYIHTCVFVYIGGNMHIYWWRQLKNVSLTQVCNQVRLYQLLVQ